MDRVLCGMRWSRCLVYLDDVISFCTNASEAMMRLEEALERLSRTEQNCVKEMLEWRQIEPSDSPWASPVVLVTKKDGFTCVGVDFHQLNSLTVKGVCILPRIDDSLRLLGNQ